MSRTRISAAKTCRKLAESCLPAFLLLALLGAGAGAEVGPRPSTQVSPAGVHGTDLISLEALESFAAGLMRGALTWYRTTPASDRMIWAGLIACAGLGLAVLTERVGRLRRRRVIPDDFTARFLDRLHEGKLDAGRALDYCEMNPSPAARVALAAVRRWGRPATDLERAVALAHRVEADRLRRNVGTLRRIAALAPLLGVLGTLTSLQRVLSGLPSTGHAAWATGLAAALSPLITGVAIATFAIAAYDALFARIESLSGALDRLGAETIEAIAMSKPPAAVSLMSSSSPIRGRVDLAHQVHPVTAAGCNRPGHESLLAQPRGEE
jgi:biopolymer transport protein ExbB